MALKTGMELRPREEDICLLLREVDNSNEREIRALYERSLADAGKKDLTGITDLRRVFHEYEYRRELAFEMAVTEIRGNPKQYQRQNETAPTSSP